MKQAINIRLEKDVVQTLDEYAQELDKTRTSLVEKAIELYLQTLELEEKLNESEDMKKQFRTFLHYFSK